MMLLNTLQDIANRVTIESEFRITHPDYRPFELPNEASFQFSDMPKAMSKKYLSIQLRNFIYGIYYNASLRSKLALSNSKEGKSLQNNAMLGIHPTFYQSIHDSNSSQGFFNPGWQVIREEMDGKKVVRQGDLTLYIDPQQHLQPEDRTAEIGKTLAVLLPKNRFMSGFYVAVGDSGPQSPTELTIRIYMNLISEGAPVLMKSITEKLNTHQIPFTFKVLYHPDEYERYDAGVLYFNQEHFEAVHPLLAEIYRENHHYFEPKVPLFTKFLAPGLGLAEEPSSKFMNEESFGINRCQIVTNALIEAWEKGLKSTEEKVAAIVNQFALMGIEVEKPYLNPNSSDLYSPLA